LPAGRQGFFSPEMAYSRKVAELAVKLGYKWIIVDELAFPGGRKSSPETLYKIRGLDLYVFFRERNLSFTILSAQIGTVPTVLRYLGDRIGKNEYLVTAMDGETFGHHRPGLELLLFDLLAEEKINPVQISDLLNKFNKIEEIDPRESTWAATKNNMMEGEPYARWNNKNNSIQHKQWDLTYLAISIAHRSPDDQNIRALLDQSLHSDQYWWSSARPWWSLEMIERGAFELRSVVLGSAAATGAEKQKAEDLYREIIYTGFEWQRSGLVDQLSRQEDEETRERLEEKEKLFVTKAEYREMIRVLGEQVKLAAKAEEYHRAAMIKDRIRELKEEVEKAKE
ncbi:MAG: hypothetical protein Q8L24_00570, partial [bacterium]|nr:hypothetical protein [bacterium]